MASSDERPVALQILQQRGGHCELGQMGRPTMIIAIVVTQGQDRPLGVDSGRTRKAANADVSTTA